MVKRIFVIFSLTLFLWSSNAWGADRVSVYILDEFDEVNYRNIKPISKITQKGLVKLWGYIKFESDTADVQPETYYLEWGYYDGTQRKLLWSYRDNKDYCVFQRKLDRIDDYHWVNKRIWTNHIGEYDFRVYVKKQGKMRIVGESTALVED